MDIHTYAHSANPYLTRIPHPYYVNVVLYLYIIYTSISSSIVPYWLHHIEIGNFRNSKRPVKIIEREQVLDYVGNLTSYCLFVLCSHCFPPSMEHIQHVVQNNMFLRLSSKSKDSAQ